MLSVLYRNAIFEADNRMQELEDILHETIALSCSPTKAVMLKDLIQTYRARMSYLGLHDGEEGSLYCRILKLSTMVDEEFCSLALQLKSKSRARNCDSAGSMLSVIPHSEGVPYDLWIKCFKQYKAELALKILVDTYSQYRSKLLAFRGLLDAYNNGYRLFSQQYLSYSTEYEDYSDYQSNTPSDGLSTHDTVPETKQVMQTPLTENGAIACQTNGFPSEAYAFSSNLVGAAQPLLNLEILNSIVAPNPFTIHDDAIISSGNSGSQLLDAIGAVAGLYTRSEFLCSQTGNLSESKVEAITVREEKLQDYADWFQQKISLKRTQQALTAWRQRYLHSLALETQIRENVLHADRLLARTFGAMRLYFLRWRRLLPIAEEFHTTYQVRRMATAFCMWREATQLISPYTLLERLYGEHTQQTWECYRALPKDLILSADLQDLRSLETSVTFLSVLGITPQFIEQRQRNKILLFIRCALRLTTYIPSLKNAHIVLLNTHARDLYTAYLQALKEESDYQGLSEKDSQVKNSAAVVFLRAIFSMKPHLISGVLPISISSLRRNVDYLRTIRAANSYQLSIMEIGFNAFRSHAHESKLALFKRIVAIAFRRFKKGTRLFKLDTAAVEQYNRFLTRRLFEAMYDKVRFSRMMNSIALMINENLIRRIYGTIREVYLFQLSLSQNEEVLVAKSNHILLSTAFRNIHARYIILYRIRFQNVSALRKRYLCRRAIESIFQVYDRQLRGAAIYSRNCINLMRRTLSGMREAFSAQSNRYKMASNHYIKVLIQTRNSIFKQWRWRTNDVRDLILVAGEQIAAIERDYKMRAFHAWRMLFQEFYSCEQYLSWKENIRLIRTAYRELSRLSILANIANNHNSIREYQYSMHIVGNIFRSMRQLSAQKVFKRKQIEEELQHRYSSYLLKQAMKVIKLAIRGVTTARMVNKLLAKRAFCVLIQQHREAIRERNVGHQIRNGLAQLSNDQIERIRSTVAALLGSFVDDKKTFNEQLNAYVSKKDLINLHGYLLQWRLYAKKNSRLVRLEGAVVNNVSIRLLYTTLHIWRSAFILVQKGHAIEALVEARLLRQALAHMRNLAFHLQYCSATIKQRIRIRLLRHTFNHLTYCLSLSRRVISISKLTYFRSVRTVFTALRQRLIELEKLYDLISTAQRRVILRVYFRHLTEAYSTNKYINLLAHRSNLSYLRSVFTQLITLHRLNSLATNLTEITIYRLKRVAFLAWLQKSHKTIQLQRSYDIVHFNLNKYTVKHAFSAWIIRCRRRLKINALQEYLWMQLSRCLLRHAYNAIMHRAEDLLLNEQLVRGSYYLRTVRNSMHALMMGAANKQTQRAREEAAADTFRRASLLKRCMFSGLRELATKRAMLHKAEQYEESLKQKELSLIFQHWLSKARFLVITEKRIAPLSYLWLLPTYFYAWISLVRAILHHRKYAKRIHLLHLHKYTDTLNRMKKQMRTNNLLKQKADHLISVQNRKCMFDALRTMMDQYSRRTGECEHWLLT